MSRSSQYRDAPTGVSEGVPLHLWLVGVLSVAWNTFGTFDYTMTNMRNPGYLAGFPAEMVATIDVMPLWAYAGWSFGVWGSLAGSILLLVRSRFAFEAFALSLLGLATSTIWQELTPLPPAMREPGMIWMNLAIWVIVVGLLLYARRMTARGILR